MNTDSFISRLVKNLEQVIIADGVLAPTFNKQNVYKGNLPQVKDPTYPNIVITYDYNLRARWVAIDTLLVSMEINSKDYETNEAAAARLMTIFDRYSTTTSAIIIMKMWPTGGRAGSPIYVKDKNSWKSIVDFELQAGPLTNG